VNDEITALKDAGGEGIEAWVIILYDSESEAPDVHYCKGFEKAYGLESMRVLYDPTQATMIYGDRETSIITDHQGQIVSEHHSDALENVVAEITEQL